MISQILKRRTFCLVPLLFIAASSSGLFGQMLYVGNAGDDTISAYVFDQDSGYLTELLPRVPSTGSPFSVTVHPNGKFVYVTNGGNANLGVNGPSLATFSIDPGTGALTLLSSVALAPGSSPQSVVIDPGGNFAFVAHQGANYVSVYAIDASTGATTAIPGSPFAAPQGPSSIVVHPNGKFAHVSAAGAGQIAAFAIGADGSLTPAAGSPFTARNNLIWMTMDPTGKYLFAVERQDNAVLVYSVNAATGALTQVGSPFPAGGGVTGVAVDPAGKFLYVSNANSGSVTVFSIGATGALTRRSDIGAIVGAYAAILDPSGKFLYVPGQGANAIRAFTIDSSSGALTPSDQFFPAGALPQRGATVLLTPPILPPISADVVSNYHSRSLPGMPNGVIAQGSRIAISGKNIGPATGAGSVFPLTSELGGASIQIQSGDVTTAALMVFASNTLVTGVLPSSTPLGAATVTVTYNGRTTAPVPITIVTTSVGIRSRNDQGSGPAVAWEVPPDTVLAPDPSLIQDQNANNLNQSAKPGQLVIVQATGLGPVSLDETQNLTQELAVPADVFVGNKLAAPLYELRVGDGSDFIVFKLPDDVAVGCYVPVAIRAGGVTSNVVTISVSASGGSCTDPGGLSASDIDAAQKAGHISMGTIVLSHIDFGPFGPSDAAAGIFGRYDTNSLLAALSPGNNGPGIRSSFITPALGTCAVSQGSATNPAHLFDTPGDPTPFQFFSTGQTLNLNGPAGTVQITAPNYIFKPDGYVITPGDYTVDNGTGSAQGAGPFKAAITLPPMLTWTNMAEFTSPDRTQDLTVTWTGGDPAKEFALIAGVAASNQVTVGFLCAGQVSAGQFTVPAWVLSSLPKSDLFTSGDQTMPGGILAVGKASFTSAGRFTAPGLDFGVLTYEQATVSLVTYQ